MPTPKPYFNEVPSQFDFVKNENEIIKWWSDNDVINRYLHKNDNSDKQFSFLDGPITANNPMGVHHAWGRTLKDLYQRYKNMQGFAQRFQNGFDCQGLWVEVEVEKEKGFKSKKDIESYGIDKFIEDCMARVNKYSQIQTQQSKRLGMFMDWDHSYYTMSNNNNYMIWAFLKKCHEEGNIYKGEDVVPWCPRCGTAISQHEIDTEGYKQLGHETVYMRFPVVRQDQAATNEFLLVWTTTPWTIPADTLVAVNPEIDYALVEFENNKYWLAKNLIKATFDQDLTPVKVVNGQQLIEVEKITFYRAAYDTLPIIKKISSKSPKHFHSVVISKDLVNDQEGTGIVHIVPGTGKEDFDLVKSDLKWDDVIFPAVDEAGVYIDGYGNLTGQNAKTHPELIIDQLKSIEGGRYLFKTKKYTHAYPVCWRCGSELIWRIVKEWYIAMDNPRPSDGKTLRDRMVAVVKNINWIPDFGLKREIDWLNNMHDWLISKKRYWGLSLPIWECPNHHFEVIGSKQELKSKAVEGWEQFEGHTPHRPWIDKVKTKCPECGQTAQRIPDVGNPWLDAGIVPFATITDPQSDQLSYLSDKKYWRKWFPADFITECFPGQFKNWFYSLIAMSAALEDTNPFETILGYALVKDERGEEMHKSKGNAIWFDDGAEKIGVDTMRWLYCRQNPEFNLFFGYNIAEEVRRQYILLYWNTLKFFTTNANLKHWQPTNNIPSTHILDRWITSCLESTKLGVEKDLDSYHHQEAISKIETFIENFSQWYIRRSRDRDDILETLHTCLDQLTLILAPFIPFLAETIYQTLHPNTKLSVHLETWPKADSSKIDTALDSQMQIVRNICQLIHAQRQSAQIKIRQPLSSATITTNIPSLSSELQTIIKDETNLKELIWETATGSDIQIRLDTTLTPQLIEEGEYRDFVRSIQVKRKEMGLSLTDQIAITAPSWPKTFEIEILAKTLAISINIGDTLAISKI